MDGVERVQEFRLGLGLVAQEMDVIDDKKGQATHGPPETLRFDHLERKRCIRS